MNNLLKVSFLFMVLVAGVIACTKESTSTYTDSVTCSATIPTYTSSVKTIIDDNCAYSGCHNAASQKEGVNLEGYTAAKDEFTNGECLCTIYHDCKPMPEGGSKLPDSTIQTLTCWVKNGCPE